MGDICQLLLRDLLICSVQWQEYGQQEAVSSYSKQSFVKAWCQGLAPHQMPHLLYPGSSLSVSSCIFLSCPRIQRCRLVGFVHLLHIPAPPRAGFEPVGSTAPASEKSCRRTWRVISRSLVIWAIASWQVSLAIQVYGSQSVGITCK